MWYAYDEGAFSQGKGPAFEPWTDWNTPQTGILALVRAAILAASVFAAATLVMAQTQAAHYLGVSGGRNALVAFRGQRPTLLPGRGKTNSLSSQRSRFLD